MSKVSKFACSPVGMDPVKELPPSNMKTSDEFSEPTYIKLLE